MKVWFVTNKHGNGDKCYYNNYEDALYFFESCTDDDEDINDSDWYSMFCKKDGDGMIYSKKEELLTEEKDFKLGEWVLNQDEMTKKEFNELAEFDGF